MRTVRHLLEAKGAEVFAVDPEAPVIEALGLMAEKGIGVVLVMRGTELAGIFSERDYARKVVLKGLSSKDTPVRDIMTPGENVVTVGLEAQVPRCMEVVTRERIRHLPVVGAGGEVVGLVSIGDLVKAVIEDQQVELDQLHSYISG